jgi:tRNA nucleotidyltransferase (CCA-adding enzyme)
MTSLASRLEELLHPDRMRVLRVCAQVAERRAIDLYLVGGVVRDALGADGSEFRPGDPDIDIAGPGVDRGFASEVADVLGGRFVASSAFGTYKLIAPVNDGPEGAEIEIDVVTSRSETYAEPGALPVVTPGSVADDLARRDFSVGAMAMVMAPPTGSEIAWGDLIDPFDGEGDVSRKLIRVLHPKSFADDPTRIFRAVRYAVRLGFELETNTGALLEDALAHIDRLSGDRVRHELERIFDEPAAGRMLVRAQELGVLRAVFAEMGGAPRALISGNFPDGPDGTGGRDAWTGLLAYPVPPARSRALSKRLNLGSRAGRVIRDVAGIRYGFHGLRSGLDRRSEVYSFLSYRSEPAIRACAAATEDETLRLALNLYVDELVGVTPSLTGDDLMEIGVPQGPDVGRLLRELLYARLDGDITSIDEERAFVRASLDARPDAH